MDLIKTAIDKGFYHLDCAEMYGNEEEVGRAIKDSEVPREKFFITNKVSQGIDDIDAAIRENLKKMQLDYFDLCAILPDSQNDLVLTPSQLSDSYSIFCQLGSRHGFRLGCLQVCTGRVPE